MSDPESENAGRFLWERIVRRCVIPQQTKLVAFVMAQFSSPNGANVRPGNAVIAAVCGMSERTAERHTKALRDLGLIRKTSNGGGRNKRAAAYRLTIPHDLMERVELLTIDERTPATQDGGSRDVNSRHDDGGSRESDEPLLPPSEDELPPFETRTPANDPPLTSDVLAHQPKGSIDQPERDFGGDVTSGRWSPEERLINLPPGMDLRAAIKARRTPA